MGYRSSGGGEPTPEMLDAIAKRHAQNTDTALDEGGTDEVTAAEAKTASDHATGDGSDHADVAANTSASHTQGTDQYLDKGGPNEMSVARLTNKLLATKPAGMVRMVSIAESGNVSGTVKSSTGYIGIRWWDGTVEIVGNGTDTGPHSSLYPTETPCSPTSCVVNRGRRWGRYCATVPRDNERGCTINGS